MDRSEFNSRMRVCQLDGIIQRSKGRWYLNAIDTNYGPLTQKRLQVRAVTSNRGSRITGVRLVASPTWFVRHLDSYMDFPAETTWQGRRRSLALLRKMWKEGIPPTIFFKLVKSLSGGGSK
jgi:hypothetical protein